MRTSSAAGGSCSSRSNRRRLTVIRDCAARTARAGGATKARASQQDGEAAASPNGRKAANRANPGLCRRAGDLYGCARGPRVGGPQPIPMSGGGPPGTMGRPSRPCKGAHLRPPAPCGAHGAAASSEYGVRAAPAVVSAVMRRARPPVSPSRVTALRRGFARASGGREGRGRGRGRR